MEAGLEHLSWAGGTLRSVDLLLVVAEPTAKSLITARRTIALAAELGIGDVRLIGNRVRDDHDEAALEAFAAEQGVKVAALLPYDETVVHADRAGVCILDSDPTAPSVQAIERLGASLVRPALSHQALK
ncbi:MAG TPA: hypothetical protein VM287_01315 [Egibacteraceae bacterium]|nr:hypothetical protein [Egibacteraceae bacterium]